MNNAGFSILNFLYLVTISVLLVISVITTFNRKLSNQNAGILLPVLNWVFFYTALVGLLNFSGKIVAVPHLFRTANIGQLIYFPLAYLYIVQSFSPRSFRYRDLLHFLPALIFIIDFFPFYMKTAEEKVAIYHHLVSSGQFGSFKEGFFMPPFFHFIIRYLLMAGYWIAQVLFVRKILSAKGDLLKQYNPSQVNWIKWLIASELVTFVPALLPVVTGSFEIFRSIIQTWALLAASIQAYFLFSHPEILYGIKGIVFDNNEEEAPLTADGYLKEQVPEITGQSQPVEKQQVQYLSETTLDKIQLELDKYMQSAKPYLQPSYGLIDLARETNFTPHQVSAFINKRCEMNFYGYINKYRIEYCKQKFISKEYVNKTLEAISHESGFQSRATFIRAFKQVTGLTPSGFIRELKSYVSEASLTDRKVLKKL